MIIKKMKILLVWPNRDEWGTKPLGISLLSAALKEKGHEVELFDTTYIDFGNETNTSSKKFFETPEFPVDMSKKNLRVTHEFIDKVEKFKPDLIGFSVLEDEMKLAEELSVIAKSSLGIPVVWGNKAARAFVDSLTYESYIDHICVRDGIPDFVNFLHDYKNRIKGELILGRAVSLETYPMVDWSIFDDRHFLKPYLGEVKRKGDHMIGWGCPNKCSFCLNSVTSESFRKYSVGKITKELAFLKKKYDLNFMKFHDEDFCYKPIRYFEELAGEYKRLVDLPFTCMINAGTTTQTKVNLLKDMGCVSVSMGIETGDPDMRRMLNRNETTGDIIRASRLFNKAGIRTSSFNMIGLPFETRETIKATIELNRMAEIEAPNIGFFYPLEGTMLKEVAIQNGFYPKEKQFEWDRPALEFDNLSEQELMDYRTNFVSMVRGEQ